MNHSKIVKLTPSKEELHGHKPAPTTERPPKPSSQNVSTSNYDEVISIALWSIRRLSHQQHKDFAYNELEKVTGKKWERV